MEKLIKALQRHGVVVITTTQIHSAKSQVIVLVPNKAQRISLINHSAKYIPHRSILHNVCN